MKKIRTISVCLLIPFFVLIVFAFLKIKNKVEYQQKVVLAHEIHKVLDCLMFDLRDAREDTLQDLPADGEWHGRFAFDNTQQGPMEYLIKGGHLLKINNGKTLLVADYIDHLRIRRQKRDPYVLEVQIEAKKNVSLTSTLKVRIRS